MSQVSQDIPGTSHLYCLLPREAAIDNLLTEAAHDDFCHNLYSLCAALEPRGAPGWVQQGLGLSWNTILCLCQLNLPVNLITELMA